MPNYTVTDPTSGRSVTLTGDSAPTEQELTEVFSKLPPATNAKVQPVTEQGLEEQPLLMGPLNQLGSSLLQKGAQGIANTAGQSSNAGIRGLGAIAGSTMLGGAEALAPQTKLGQATMLAAPFAMGAASGISGASKALANNETAAQALQTSMGGIERNTQAVLNDPGMLARAKPIEDASENYASKIPGLQGLVDYIKTKYGENVPAFSDFKKVLNESKANIANGTGGTQDALNQVQSVNAILKHKDFDKSPQTVRSLMQDREQGIGLLEQTNPGFADANKDLREAHLADFFQNWLPQNKSGTPSVLRGSMAAMNVAKGIAEIGTGSPVQGVTRLGAAALSSPKMVGLGLRGLSALGKPIGGAAEAPATMAELTDLSEQIAQKNSNVQNLKALAEHHQNYAKALMEKENFQDMAGRLSEGVLVPGTPSYGDEGFAQKMADAGLQDPRLPQFVTPESYGGAPITQEAPSLIPTATKESFPHKMKSDKFNIQANKEAADLEALKRTFKKKAATIQNQPTEMSKLGKFGVLDTAVSGQQEKGPSSQRLAYPANLGPLGQ